MSDCRHCTPCTLERIEGATSRLEIAMAKASDQINELSGKLDELGAVVTDVHSDFEALRAVMTAERENLTDAGQAALDAANDKAAVLAERLSSLDVAVGDADGSDIPTGGGTGETPAEPTAPVEDTPAPPVEGAPVDEAAAEETPVDPEDAAPPAGEGTVVNPDLPADGGDEDLRPTA